MCHYEFSNSYIEYLIYDYSAVLQFYFAYITTTFFHINSIHDTYTNYFANDDEFINIYITSYNGVDNIDKVIGLQIKNK